LLPKSFTGVVRDDQALDPSVLAVAPLWSMGSATTKISLQKDLGLAANHSSYLHRYPPAVLVDPAPPNFKTLLNRYLLGPYLASRIPEHSMDAVIMAAGPDATLAASVHNLFHLCGFRRFVFVVNDAKDCSVVLDLVPQHNPLKPHLCLDHKAFYNAEERRRIGSKYPALHRGAPGKLQRGNSKVQVPRIGWYLQQFSKFLVPKLVVDLSPQYLAIDGDLIFTRPFSFEDGNGTYVMPTTTKSPKHWRYFVDWIFGQDPKWQNDTNTKLNFVVGWMVLDQNILKDLIADMNRLIEDPDEFPFNILNEGERIINTTFFSEFYIYARYAHHHPSNLYQSQQIAEPARNKGGFRYTCVLTKNTYGQAQSDLKLAPFLIWEEHKHHVFHSCPDRETTEQMTQLSTVGIWHDFHPPPWGGGNQLLLALRKGLEEWNNLTVLVKSDVAIQTTDEDRRAQDTAASSQVLLANSVTFKGSTDRLEQLKAKNNLALVHRVDGPYYSTRYGRSVANLTIPVQPSSSREIGIPQEDKKTKQLNRQFACATVFQSQWSLEANLKIGLNLRNPVLIPNTVDPDIFYPSPKESLSASQRKIRILATSHSSNARKGFDTLLWIDSHVDRERFEVVYMGGTPKYGFTPRYISILPQVDSQGVADFLRTGDIYLAPSRDEPASNAVMEALACGLPVLYQEGSSHAELVGDAGRGFSRAGPQLLQALDEMVERHNQLVQAIRVPSMKDISRQYLAIMQWCFYMKHLYF
jgi:hypothetical protein